MVSWRRAASWALAALAVAAFAALCAWGLWTYSKIDPTAGSPRHLKPRVLRMLEVLIPTDD